MTAYGILFQLDVIHDYYAPGPVPIRLEPWGPTRDLLVAIGARMIARGSRIMVACSDDRTGLPSQAEDRRIDAVFALRPDSADFSLVTDGLAVRAGQVPTFDAVQVVPPLPAAEPPRPAGETAAVQAIGVRTPAAFVRLRFDPAATAVRFELRLGAPEMPWTYHVIGGTAEAALSIRDTAGDVRFTNLGPRSTGGFGTAIGLRSDTAIPLRARPPQRFELLGEGPFGKRVIVPVLPAPRPGPTADIYVNLT